jgi:hypothetical protein
MEKGGENNTNVRREVSKMCVDTERQKMEENMRKKRLQVQYIELNNNWEKEIHIEVHTREARRYMMVDNGHLELKYTTANTDQETGHICKKKMKDVTTFEKQGSYKLEKSVNRQKINMY